MAVNWFAGSERIWWISCGVVGSFPSWGSAGNAGWACEKGVAADAGTGTGAGVAAEDKVKVEEGLKDSGTGFASVCRVCSETGEAGSFCGWKLIVKEVKMVWVISYGQ